MVLVEDYFETDETASLVPGGKWRDCALIARKPVLEGALREEFYDQLGKIAAPFSNLNFSGIRPPNTTGPCFADYESSVLAKYRPGPLKILDRLLRGRRLPDIYKH